MFTWDKNFLCPSVSGMAANDGPELAWCSLPQRAQAPSESEDHAEQLCTWKEHREGIRTLPFQ